MKLKTQETIRKIELGTWIGASVASSILTKTSDAAQLAPILENIRNIGNSIYLIDYLSSFLTQTITEEHKELTNLYRKILENTKDFYNDFNLNDPIEIFAMYVYMYRKGYFSHNHNFQYSTDMKDLAKLMGVDVIRGDGVCRSISSMLTDIYREMGYESHNLYVKTDREAIKNLDHLCSEILTKKDNSQKFVKLVMLLTKYLPLGNHLITMTEHEGKNYILDPTNDGLLFKGEGNKLLIANNPNHYMKNYLFYIPIYSLLGVNDEELDLRRQINQLKLPSITKEEYQKTYLETLKICLENQDLFEHFYKDNKDYIDEIYNISKDQNDMIRRLIPIIPKKRK